MKIINVLLYAYMIMFLYGIKDDNVICCNVSLSLELSNIFYLQLQTCKVYK
jgi:hypothetical protein